MLEIRHLKKAYESATPLTDINFTIGSGETVSIIGPSGTGKSTILRCINGLEAPTSGKILFNGIDITDPKTDMNEIRKHIGMIFQGFNLFPHLTVLQNVMIPQMDLLGRSKQEAYDKACELLKQVGLFDRAGNYPGDLSGGQKQRVAIARTLAMDNDIILLDEPTSALDPAMVGEVENVIHNLAQAGKTMIIVTHEMRLAQKVSSRILFVCDGVIYEDGTPEQIFEHPEKEKTRQFIFRVHTLPIHIDSPYFDFYDCMTEITRFADLHNLSYTASESIRSVFEELVVIHLLPKMTAQDTIDVTVSCSDMTDQITMTVMYTGATVKSEDDLSEMSRAIISHRSTSVTFSPVGENGDPGCITVKIKK